MNAEVSLAPFNPTSERGQQVAMDLLQLSGDDILFDLGCGDARFLLKAAKMVEGLHCIGIEIDENFANRAMQNIEKESSEIQGRIRIILEDVATCEERIVSEATAIFLYLVPAGIRKIRPILEKVRQKSNCRIVSYLFSVPDWEPDAIGRGKANLPLFLYRSKR